MFDEVIQTMNRSGLNANSENTNIYKTEPLPRREIECSSARESIDIAKKNRCNFFLLVLSRNSD